MATAFRGAHLRLLPNERRVLELLSGAAGPAGVQVRIAGGWVREKMLPLVRPPPEERPAEEGDSAPDMDVAVDTMSGEAFCDVLRAHVAQLPAREGERLVSSVGVVRRNPSRSKHLETATAAVAGVQLDFVNLRGESYAAASRIPAHVHVGSPAEDALRRDLTVNALFYNVEADVVEDFTGRGVADLRAGVVAAAAPDPHAMLRDDPLRALRAVRFAARLGFVYDADLAAALAAPPVAEGLRARVSRERVWTELAKMLDGADPRRCVRDLAAFGLLHATLAPLAGPDASADNAAAVAAAEALPPRGVAAAAAIGSFAPRHLYLAAMLRELVPRAQWPTVAHPRRPLLHWLKEDGRLSHMDAATVVEMMLQAQLVLEHAAADAPALFAPGTPGRVALGRRWRGALGLWRASLLVAAAGSRGALDPDDLVARALREGLVAACERPMPLDGDELARRTGLAGVQLGAALRRQEDLVLGWPAAAPPPCAQDVLRDIALETRLASPPPA